MQTNKQQIKGLKRVIAIVVSQIILLMALLSLTPDMNLASFDSVKVLLDSISHEKPQRPEFGMASWAIRRASRNNDILAVVVIVTSLTVLTLSVLIFFQMRRAYRAKDL